jgi:hypothetical protein
MTDAVSTKLDSCQNCGEALTGDFCGKCGQRDKESRRAFIILLQETLYTVFELDGRAYKTLWYLFSKPAFLSTEYTSGRRASYTPPLRLFLVISIGFFLLVSLSTSLQPLRNTAAGVDPASTVTADFNLSFRDGNVEILTGEDFSELDEEDIEDIEELLNFVSEIELPFLPPAANQNLQGFLVTQVEANFQDVVDDPASFFMGSLEYITLFMLLMMPLLALIQQVLYITRKRFYVEHFILMLHNHTFLVFSIFLLWVSDIIEELEIPLLSSGFGWIDTAVGFWIVIYLYLSLKRFFGEGYFVTTLKFVTVSLIYSVCVGVGIMLFFFLLFIFS